MAGPARFAVWGYRGGLTCHRGEYANVLLAAKGPWLRVLSSALQALQIATSSAAEAVWCASGVIADYGCLRV